MVYKMFNSDLTCRGFQYEIGKTYKMDEKDLAICGKGFHYCENPLDCLNYYDLLNNNCELNPICEVEPLGKIVKEDIDEDTKRATNKIKIGAKLSFDDFIEATRRYFKNKGELWSNPQYNLESRIAIKGFAPKVISIKDWASIASCSIGSKWLIRGINVEVAISAESQVFTSGRYARVATSGVGSKVATTGDYSKVVMNGHDSRGAVSGENSIIANIGINGMAKGVKGTWITLAEYKFNNNKGAYVPIYVKSFKVDGKRIKENTFYKLENKKLVEVKIEEE